MDVAIVGVGLHPFGRFAGVSAIEMGAIAIRRALADASVEWRDIQFAFGGSYEVDNPDAVVALIGLTGIPFTDVYNGCATAASALTLAANTIRLGDHELGIAVGMDKHIPGAFTGDPRDYACPSWYGELGHFITTKFFGMKINKYMRDHGISHATLAKVAAKGYRNGARNPNAFRRKPLSEEEILASKMLNYPLTQYMFCAPDEGAAAVVLCRAEHARRYSDKPIYLRATHGSHATTRRVRGAQPVAPDRADAGSDGRRVARRLRDGRDRSRRRRRDPAPGHRRRGRDHPPGRERLLRRRRAGEARRRRRARDRGPPARQHRRRSARERRADRRLGSATDPRGGAAAAGPGGDRQVPGSPKVGYTQLYGAPGTAGVSILSV